MKSSLIYKEMNRLSLHNLSKNLAAVLDGQQQAGIATLAAKIVEIEEVFNPNAVKVVLK